MHSLELNAPDKSNVSGQVGQHAQPGTQSSQETQHAWRSMIIWVERMGFASKLRMQQRTEVWDTLHRRAGAQRAVIGTTFKVTTYTTPGLQAD